MGKLPTTLLSAILLLSFSTLAYPGDDDGRAIVNKAIEAAGGEAKLAKFQSMTWKDKGTYYGMGDGLPYQGVYTMQRPDKFRMVIEGVFVMVFNGNQAWIQTAGGTEEMPKDRLAVEQHNHKAGWIASLLPLKEKAYLIKTLPDLKVGDHDSRVVEVSRKGHPTVKLFFDKKSGLLIKYSFQSKSPEQGFKEILSESYYSDFRMVGGARLPHKTVMKQDGKLFVESNIVEIRPIEKVDPKLFAKPVVE